MRRQMRQAFGRSYVTAEEQDVRLIGTLRETLDPRETGSEEEHRFAVHNEGGKGK